MATRYLALVARGKGLPETLLTSIQERIGFHPTAACEGVSLLVNAGARCTELPGGGGAVVGTLFRRDGRPKSVDALAPAEVNDIRESEGLSLITHYWGGYVAFVKAAQGRSVFVLRDPTAEMPCYYIDIDGASVFSSDIDSLVDSGLLCPCIAWEFLPSHLYYADLRTPRTGLSGVRELLGGTRFSTSNWGERVTQVWSPWDHVTDPKLPDLEAARAVADTATRCVQAWASTFRHVLLGVSGGLDSSIVAASLKEQRTPWSCMTMVTQEADGDERAFARILTKAMAQPLAERFHNLEDIDLSQATTAHLPRPIGFLFGQSQEKTRLSLAHAHDADAFFTGQGGDNVFCFLRSATPVLDRLQAKGLTPGVARTMIDVAHLSGCSIPTVAKTAFQRARRQDRSYHWRGDGTYLQQKAPPVHYAHPWLQLPAKALAGKAVQISMLVRIQGTLDGFPRDLPAPLITPLLSQPLIELCLSLPTWQWCGGGVDRALARRGFRGRLPDALLDRRSKGGPNSFSVQVIEAFRAELRERLLDGVLATHDLLDRPAIEAALKDGVPIRSPDHLRLLALAEAEAWACHWIERRSQIIGNVSANPLTG